VNLHAIFDTHYIFDSRNVSRTTILIIAIRTLNIIHYIILYTTVYYTQRQKDRGLLKIVYGKYLHLTRKDLMCCTIFTDFFSIFCKTGSK